MAILITGGAGYIGSHTNKLLHQHGYDTVIIDDLSKGHRDAVKWGTFIHGDFGDSMVLSSCFKAHSIDAVLHFGALSEVGESVEHPERYYQNNLANTLTLLRVMREHHILKMVFSSTCAVYGIPETLPLTETHPIAPINPYGRAKSMVEAILADYRDAYGLRYVSLRYFNAAGADPELELGERHNPESHLIPIAIEAALGTRTNVSIYGTDYPTPDGSCIRDYIHVSDLAMAHLNALHYLEKNGNSEVFNLGNGNGYSVKEVIESVSRLSGREVPTQYAPRRVGDPPILIANAEKAHRDLGWTPTYSSLDEIVESALRFKETRL